MGASVEPVMATQKPETASERDPVAITAAVYPDLIGLARFLGCPDSPEDWVQETLIETLRRHPGYDGIADPRAYTRTVLLRLVTRGRIRARRVTLGLDDESAAASGRVEDLAPSVVGRLNGEEVLARLPLRQRACVYLSVVCELTDREAAEALGCRPSTVRSNVARALARLARESTEATG